MIRKIALGLLVLGTACAGDPQKGNPPVGRVGITPATTVPVPASAEASTEEVAVPTVPTPTTARLAAKPTPKMPTSPHDGGEQTSDDGPIPDVFRGEPDSEPVPTTTTTQVSTTTTTTRPATTTTTMAPTTTTTTRPAPKGELVAESSSQQTWIQGDPPCKPVQVILLNHSDTRVVSVDITFYLYDFDSMGAVNYWEGPYRKMVSIPADNGTRAPYQVTVDVCPSPRAGHRWWNHPNHPDYPAGVQLTWKWQS